MADYTIDRQDIENRAAVMWQTLIETSEGPEADEAREIEADPQRKLALLHGIRLAAMVVVEGLQEQSVMSGEVEQKALAAARDEALREAVEAVRVPFRRLSSGCIATVSNEPYPDDSGWTPWSRFVGPYLAQVDEALTALADRLAQGQEAGK